MAERAPLEVAVVVELLSSPALRRITSLKRAGWTEQVYSAAMSILSMTIEQLDLSVRSSTLLQTLGASTLAEVLALPVIEASAMSITELTEVFEELDVKYRGCFVSLVDPEK